MDPDFACPLKSPMRSTIPRSRQLGQGKREASALHHIVCVYVCLVRFLCLAHPVMMFILSPPLPRSPPVTLLSHVSSLFAVLLISRCLSHNPFLLDGDCTDDDDEREGPHKHSDILRLTMSPSKGEKRSETVTDLVSG